MPEMSRVESEVPFKAPTETETGVPAVRSGAKPRRTLLYSRMWSNAYELIPASTRLVVCAV